MDRVYLSSLYIDGYGPYEDTLIEGLGNGLNVIITKDDDGADALREFFWAVLQGFQPDDSRASQAISIRRSRAERALLLFLTCSQRPCANLTWMQQAECSPD